MTAPPNRAPRRVQGVCALALAAPLAEDWPRFLGPEGTGHSAETGLSRDWSDGGPAELWSVEIGYGYGGAAIRDGEVYLLDREISKADILRCFSLETGEETWRHQYAASGRLQFHGSRSVPTVTEKFVYTQGAFGHLNCYDRQTHEPVWTVNLRRQYKTFMPVYGWVQSPLVAGDLVYAAPLSQKVGLVALNRFTGEEVWRTDGVGTSHSTPRIVTLHGEEQLVFASTYHDGGLSSGGLSKSYLSCFDPDEGTLRWRTDHAFRAQLAIPVPVPLGGNRLFLTSGYRCGSTVVEVERDAGGLWSVRIIGESPRGAQVHTPLVIDDHVYLIANENENDTRRKRSEGGLVCFDLEAREQWRTGDAPYLGRGSTLAVDGLLLIQDGKTGVLHLVEPDPAGFELLGTKDVFGTADDRRDLRMWSPMALSNGRLLIRSQTELKCLELIPRRAQEDPPVRPEARAAKLLRTCEESLRSLDRLRCVLEVHSSGAFARPVAIGEPPVADPPRKRVDRWTLDLSREAEPRLVATRERRAAGPDEPRIELVFDGGHLTSWFPEEKIRFVWGGDGSPLPELWDAADEDLHLDPITAIVLGLDSLNPGASLRELEAQTVDGHTCRVIEGGPAAIEGWPGARQTRTVWIDQESGELRQLHDLIEDEHRILHGRRVTLRTPQEATAVRAQAPSPALRREGRTILTPIRTPRTTPIDRIARFRPPSPALEEPISVSWRTLTSYEYEPRAVERVAALDRDVHAISFPPAVEALHGRRVCIEGAITPLQIEGGRILSFLIEEWAHAAFSNPHFYLGRVLVDCRRCPLDVLPDRILCTGRLAVQEEFAGDGHLLSAYHLVADQIALLDD